MILSLLIAVPCVNNRDESGGLKDLPSLVESETANEEEMVAEAPENTESEEIQVTVI